MTSRRLHDEGVAAAGAVVDPHALGLQVALDRLRAVLAAEPRGLVAAERHQEADRAVSVDPHRAGADALGHRRRTPHRLRPDAGAEPVGDVVGDRDRLLLVPELDHRQHRPEHLLLGDAHAVVDAGEDGRLHEILAAALLLARGSAAQHALGSFPFRNVDVGEDLLVLRRRRHRPDLGLGQARVAELGLLGHGDQLLDELVVDRLLQQQPRAGDAGLARRREDAGDGAAHRIVQDAVVEHDVGRLAAELQRHLLEGLGGELVDARARCGAAGEGDLGDLWMRDQRLADHGAVARHHVDDARRQLGRLDHELHELEQRGRRELGRLDHHRAARRQRRRQLPADQHQRRVPRRDERAHADRLLEDVGEVVGPVGRHHGTLNLVGEPAVVIEPLGQVLGLRRHLRDQLAVVAHLDLRQVLGVLLDQAGDAAQHLAARRSASCRPRPLVEGAPGRLAGPVGVLGVALRDQRPRLAGVGVVASGTSCRKRPRTTCRRCRSDTP